MGKAVKGRRRGLIAWLAGGVGLLVGLFGLWSATTGYIPGAGSVCHSRNWPLLWAFKDDGTARLIPGLRCEGDDHHGRMAWRPFRLATIGFDRHGMCNKALRLYTYKQGASAVAGDYRLDSLQDAAFFKTTARDRAFSDRKAYCLNESPGCLVRLMPVCREPGQPETAFNGIVGNGTQIMTSCGRNDLRREVGLPRDDYEDMAGFALAEEGLVNARGFRYTLANGYGLPSGTRVIVEGDYGKLRCYYDATRSEDGERRWATTDEGINSCMDLLADPNRYCDGDGSNPGPNIY